MIFIFSWTDLGTQRNLAQVGALGLGLVPRAGLSPSQSPGGNSNHSFPSRPGSRTSPAVQGQTVLREGRPNSRPSSSHEVPIIREANPNQPGNNPSVLDFSQGMKTYSPYPGGQPRRPSSAMSEPGISSHRALSPHIPPGTQPHMLIGEWKIVKSHTGFFFSVIYSRLPWCQVMIDCLL